MSFLCDAESGRASTGRVFCFGYDDNGTPDDDSDDGYFYYIRWYRLASGRDSSYGEIWLYDPDFDRVQSWSVPSLYCVGHGYADGLRANPEGLLHGVILRVPVSVMEKAGIYRFVLHFYDDYTDSYKNHQVKAALEKNALLSPDELHIWIDIYNRTDFKDIAYWSEVERAFAKIAELPAFVHPDPTNGPVREHWFGTGRLTVKYRSLDINQQRRSKYRTVIVTAFPGSDPKHWGSTDKRKFRMTPDDPVLSVIFTESIANAPESWREDPDWEKKGYTNAIVHEITHVANDKQQHCPQGVETCIWRAEANRYFLTYWRNRISYTWQGQRLWYNSPWHNLDEINKIRATLRHKPLSP